VGKRYSETTDLIVGYYCHDSARHKPSSDQIAMIRTAISDPIRAVYCVNLNDNYVLKLP